MGDQLAISSFVIRFVQDTSDPETPVKCRGAIHHVQSDDSCSFTKWTDTEAFMQRYITLETMSPGASWPVSEDTRAKD